MADTFSRVESGVASARVGDEVVLLDSRSGKYYGLNPVGAKVWDLLSTAAPLEQMSAQIAADFDRDPADVQRDVASYLADLVRLGLATER